MAEPLLWLPGAERLPNPDTAPTDGGKAKAIAHITWDINATADRPADLLSFERLRDYFGKNPDGMKSAPHFLLDPFTGRTAQFYTPKSRSKSLADGPGGTRTNRAGSVVIQVEVLFFPYCRVGGRVYARLVDTPMKGWADLNAYIRSWGVPDVWPMGRPVDFTAKRHEATWATRAGWYAHAHVPENDHVDPGSWPGFTGQDPLPEEDDMATALELWGYKNKTDAAANPQLPDAYGFLRQSHDMLRKLIAETAAVKAALAALAADGGLDAAQVQAAAQRGAEAALRELGEQLTDQG